MNLQNKLKVIIPTGLALFAMFFGAGNMIFPLELGSMTGQYTWFALAGFLISSVGVPFLGLYAGALYEGDYWAFFETRITPLLLIATLIGLYGSLLISGLFLVAALALLYLNKAEAAFEIVSKVSAFTIVTFLILIIGPLFAAPRTETIAYSTLLASLPVNLQNPYIFDFIYFFVVYLVISKESRVVDIIGCVLSPVKICTFTILIILGLYYSHPITMVSLSAEDVFRAAILKGYSTMDLLASLFFCTVAYRNIEHKCHSYHLRSHKEIMRMTLYSCVIGAILISLVYTGFIYVAAMHAHALQGYSTAGLLGKISYIVLGEYGALLVGVCVTLACLTTASALAEVTTEFFHETLFANRVPRSVCVILTLTTMYIMAILGFDKIMEIADPVLNILYPMLIILCLLNILLKLKVRAA